MENQIKPFNVGAINPTIYQGTPMIQNQANVIQVRDDILSNEIVNLQQSMLANNRYMQSYMDSVDKRLEKATKKKYRLRVQQFMCIDSNDNICLRVIYDDDSSECIPFIINCKGKWNVHKLKFSKTEQAMEYFAIIFPLSVICIVGKVGSDSGRKLYDAFIRAGVKFNEKLPVSRIQEALFQQFAPEIESARADMFIVEKAGWNNGTYASAETYPFLRRRDFPTLPILKKRFPVISSEGDDFQRYFQALRSVKDWRYRLVLATYPFAGILASVLAEEHIRIPIYLNFVMLDDSELELIPAFMQIFNREALIPTHLDESEKKFLKIIYEANDEVLIFEALTSQDDMSYRTKKIYQNRQRITQIALGKCGITIGYKNGTNVALVVMSDSVQIGSAVKNIFVDNNFVEDAYACMDLLSGSTMTAVFSEFVRFAGQQMELVRSIIRRHRVNKNRELAFWECMFTILEKFWRTVGVNVYEMAEFSVGMDIGELCELDLYNCEDLLDVFVRIVREEIRNYIVCDKRKAGCADYAASIYFDENFIWFQPNVLEELLYQRNVVAQKHAILLELRKRGYLKVDSEGFTRKLQVNGIRRETYQVSRELFNRVGYAEIIDLAREVY